MSQSSETTNSLEYLGYPEGLFANNYYTARIKPDVGVCVANMGSLERVWMVHFFPWSGPDWKESGPLEPTASGHERYARFICAKATADIAANQELFHKWPFELCDVNDGILLLKCLIEETIKTLEHPTP